MTATSEILTAAQIATLRQKYDLINASHSSDDSQKGLWSSLYSDLYDLITDFTLVNEPKAGVDPQSWLSAAKPQAKRYDIRDIHFPNFGVRVSPNGGKSFFVSYRHGPKQRRMKIGTYPRTSLSVARTKAMDALRQVDEGIDPAGRRRQPGLLVDAVVKDFIRQHAKPRGRTARTCLSVNW